MPALCLAISERPEDVSCPIARCASMGPPGAHVRDLPSLDLCQILPLPLTNSRIASSLAIVSRGVASTGNN
eukprot:12888604-Prorocentrum_lima.AAC.1